jgi:dynein assembly factor 3
MATTAQSVLMSLGMVNMWGFSPAFDMLHGGPGLKALTEAPSKAPLAASDASNEDGSIDTDPIRILLIGPGDIRHAIATIAHRKRYATRPLHIYIYEKSIETLARHFLLLQIAQDWQLPIRQRCNLFLEVFGNSRVQVS